MTFHFGDAFINLHAKSVSLEDAREVFDKMVERDVISWNIMVGAYAESGDGDEALKLFLQMQREGIKPTMVTFMCILNPNTSAGAKFDWLEEVYSRAVKVGLESEVRVCNAFINMFAKSGSMKRAFQVFKKMVKRDVIMWTLMIGVYAASGHGKEAFQTFVEMQQEGVEPNAITYMALLDSHCASSEAMDLVREVHSKASKAGLATDVRVGNALINMYANCGSIKDANQVFSGLGFRGMISWTAMIGAYAKSGDGNEAFRLFLQG